MSIELAGRWAALMMATSFAAPVAAAPARTPAVLQALGDCRAIADGAVRLACYDKAAAGIADATAKKDIVVLDREEVRATRKGLFGFSLPKLNFFGNEKEAKDDTGREEIVEIDVVVKSARSFSYQLWRMTMEDGATWVTTEASTLITPRAGSKVHIKRAALGSYFIKVDGSRAVKGRREG